MHEDRVGTGVFLIGLAVLFMTGFWWPGILLVIGATNIARGVAAGREWHSVPSGIWLIGLGLLFTVGFRWELLLIFAGVSMLLGYSYKTHWCEWTDCDDEKKKRKRKNDEKAKNDPEALGEVEWI